MRRARHDHEPPPDEEYGAENERVELQPRVEASPTKIFIESRRHASYSGLDKFGMRWLLGMAAVLKLQPRIVRRNGGLHPSYALAPGVEADAPAEDSGTNWPQRTRQKESICLLDGKSDRRSRRRQQKIRVLVLASSVLLVERKDV